MQEFGAKKRKNPRLDDKSSTSEESPQKKPKSYVFLDEKGNVIVGVNPSERENKENTLDNLIRALTPTKKSSATKRDPNKHKKHQKHKKQCVEETANGSFRSVTCLKTLTECVNEMSSYQLRVLLCRLAAKDLSLLKAIEEQRLKLPSTSESKIVAIPTLDVEALKKKIRCELEDDESMYYVEKTAVVLTQRCSKHAKVIREYARKAELFCNNGDIENSIKLLQVVTEEAIPVIDDIDDSYERLAEALKVLVETWKFVIASHHVFSQEIYEELMELFGVVHSTVSPYGYEMFGELIQNVEVTLLDQTLRAFQKEQKTEVQSATLS